MLLSTLQSIELKKILIPTLSEEKISELMGFLVHYKSEMWIYPGVLKRRFGLSTKVTYELMNKLSEQGLVKAYYELCCGHCHKSSGEVYETINQIPETFYCELCEDELGSLENAIIIYKVI